MNTKQLGNIGEAKVLSEFVRIGIPVYIPFGDNEKSDLVAEFNGKLNRIQIKTSEKIKEGKVEFSINSSTSHRNNGKKFNYTKEHIDYFALYNLELNEVLIIPVEDTGKSKINFRIELPKNNQKIGIKYYTDYLLKNKIPHKL